MRNESKFVGWGEIDSNVEGIVRWHAKRIFPALQGLMEEEDLVSVGMAAAMEASARFDPSQGATLKTWCGNQAFHRMRNYLKNARFGKINGARHGCKIRLVPISQMAKHDSLPPEAIAGDDEEQKFLETATDLFRCLPPRERRIARGLWIQERQLVDVAREHGITPQRVKQISAVARERIRRHMQRYQRRGPSFANVSPERRASILRSYSNPPENRTVDTPIELAPEPWLETMSEHILSKTTKKSRADYIFHALRAQFPTISIGAIQLVAQKHPFVQFARGWIGVAGISSPPDFSNGEPGRRTACALPAPERKSGDARPLDAVLAELGQRLRTLAERREEIQREIESINCLLTAACREA